MKHVPSRPALPGLSAPSAAAAAHPLARKGSHRNALARPSARPSRLLPSSGRPCNALDSDFKKHVGDDGGEEEEEEEEEEEAH